MNKRADNPLMSNVTIIVIPITLFICFISGLTYVGKVYNIWSNEMDGKALLAKAEYEKQIKTTIARQKMESAKYESEAEIIRAKGVAEANRIISDGLGGPEGYLRYLWIDGLKSGGSTPQVIYVPTEAGLPILEAGKRNKE